MRYPPMPLALAALLTASANIGLPIVIENEDMPRRRRNRVAEGIRYRRDLLDGNADITHIDTPKAISKRKARRLRGKARQA